MKVDLLFKNGKVLTLDHNNRRAGSVAVSKGKIVGIWETAEPPKGEVEITQQTNVVDLEGAALLPGFIDTHNHMLMYGQTRDMVNCSTPPHKSIKDILGAIGEKAKETQNGEWIRGFGYDDTLIYEKRHLTRADLDQVTPNNPVFVSHASGHLAYANTLAIQMAGLKDTISDPQGGHFGRDENGRLNGVLYEFGAQQPINNLIPKPTVEELVRILGTISTDYVAQGITTNSDAAIFGLDDFEAHLQASKLRVNPMRMQLMMMHYLLSDGAPYGGYTSEQLDIEIQARSGGWAKLDSAKMFQDGSIQGLTGALREPYYQNSDVYGDFIHPQEFLNEEVLKLHRRGYRITTHGNGDRAIGSILDAYEYALKQNPRTDHRHRIEHVQSATTADIARMEKLGVAGSFFINHVYYWGDRHEKIFLGPKRGRRISPLADAVEHDLLFALHSDCPITPISPLFSVWAAVNRITREGNVLGPEQRIDVVTALKSMTIYGARFIFDEDHSGSIEIGKKADFVVLEEDPTAINPLDIKDVSIQSTYINGEPVYGQTTAKTT